LQESMAEAGCYEEDLRSYFYFRDSSVRLTES
jgi:hypothetical protein